MIILRFFTAIHWRISLFFHAIDFKILRCIPIANWRITLYFFPIKVKIHDIFLRPPKDEICDFLTWLIIKFCDIFQMIGKFIYVLFCDRLTIFTFFLISVSVWKTHNWLTNFDIFLCDWFTNFKIFLLCDRRPNFAYFPPQLIIKFDDFQNSSRLS